MKVIGKGFRWILLQIVLLTITSLLYANLAVGVMWFIFLAVGLLFIQLCFRSHTTTSRDIFSFVSLIYFIYTVVTDLVYVQNPHTDYFFALDSLMLFNEMDEIVRSDSPLSAVYFYFRAFPGFGLISWGIAKFAYYMGENAVIVQKLHVTLIAALIPVVLYNIAIKFFSRTRAIAIALSFAFLTHLFTYSALLLRDLHIMFIYILGFYILLSKWKLRNIGILILLLFIVWQFRVQNGIFFIVFLLAYIYIPFYKSKSIIINSFFAIILGGIMLMLVGSSSMLQLDSDVGDKLSGYEEYHDNKLNKGEGAAQTIVSLPGYIRPVIFIVISQLAPFPFYNATYVGTLLTDQYLLFPLAIAILFWIIVLTFLIYGLFKSRLRKLVISHLNLSFFIAILFIIVGAMSSPEYRRLLPAYPIVFLASSFVYYSMRKTQRKYLLRVFFVIYGGLVLISVLM